MLLQRAKAARKKNQNTVTQEGQTINSEQGCKAKDQNKTKTEKKNCC